VLNARRREAARELQKSWKQLSVDEILEAPYALIGSVDEMVESLHVRRERWGLSYFVTFEPYLETLPPVAATPTGKKGFSARRPGRGGAGPPAVGIGVRAAGSSRIASVSPAATKARSAPE